MSAGTVRGARRRDRSGRRVADLSIRVIKLRRVQDVERFGAELEMLVGLLGEIEFLEQRTDQIASCQVRTECSCPEFPKV